MTWRLVACQFRQRFEYTSEQSSRSQWKQSLRFPQMDTSLQYHFPEARHRSSCQQYLHAVAVLLGDALRTPAPALLDWAWRHPVDAGVMPVNLVPVIRPQPESDGVKFRKLMPRLVHHICRHVNPVRLLDELSESHQRPSWNHQPVPAHEFVLWAFLHALGHDVKPSLLGVRTVLPRRQQPAHLVVDQKLLRSHLAGQDAIAVDIPDEVLFFAVNVRI